MSFRSKTEYLIPICTTASPRNMHTWSAVHCMQIMLFTTASTGNYIRLLLDQTNVKYAVGINVTYSKLLIHKIEQSTWEKENHARIEINSTGKFRLASILSIILNVLHVSLT